MYVMVPEDNLHELILSFQMQVPRLDLTHQAWKQVLCTVFHISGPILHL